MPEDNNQTDNNQNNNNNNNNDANNANATNNATQGKYSEVILGCDSNGVNDEGCLSTVEKALTAAGYKVNKLGIAPGPFADYSYSSEAKGKAGVYLMAASLVSFLDAAEANFDYNVFGIRGDVTSWGTEEGFKTKGVPKDHHGDCTLATCDKYQGKTYPELNEIYKGKCVAVPGETPEKLAQNIVQALGGQYAGSGGGSSGGGAQVKDKTFEHCIKRICAATDSVFLVENNAAVLFPYTDWMAFTLRQQINTISASQMDPDLFEIDYNTEGFYNKVTTVWGADEGSEEIKTDDKENEEEKKKIGNTTTIQKQMPTGGTKLSEQYDPLVDIYGELEKKVTTNFPNEETAHYVMNSLLIQYIRDFNNSCRVRAINNQKFIGGTFYAVENPFTKKSELFYLNSYTVFKNKDQPITMDLEFKYGPEGAEEILDYQAYGGGGGGSVTTADGSADEVKIWTEAAKIHYAHENSTENPEEAWKMFGGKEPQSSTDCYGMSAYLYYRFNNQAGIPCRVVGNSEHHVVMIYKNNQWKETRDEYRSYNFETNFKWRESQDTTVLLEAKNPPSGSTSNANPSGNTANQSTVNK